MPTAPPPPEKEKSGQHARHCTEAVKGLAAPIALVGFGVEGQATLAFLRAQGHTAPIQVFDHALTPERCKALAAACPHTSFHGAATPAGDNAWAESLAASGTIFRSPGVRPDLPPLRHARRTGTVLSSALELFMACCPGTVVGITGTVGKGTTATLIGQGLTAAGIPHRMGGNIGLNPLSFLAEMDAKSVAVLELSSFQLMELRGPRPQVAVLLRTSSEHLDWHTDLREYRLAKKQLLGAEGQRVIYCADSAGSRELAGGVQGAEAVSLTGAVADGIGIGQDGGQGQVQRFRAEKALPLAPLEQLALPGAFNLENAAAAWLAVEALLIQRGTGAARAAALAAIAAFPGLPHRLQWVGAIGGVDCYNDAYATRPDAVMAALDAFERPFSVILGGSEKFADFSPLCAQLCRQENLRQVVLIGATAQRLAEELRHAARERGGAAPPLFHAASLKAAFQSGLTALEGEGVLLFSPGCASFDMFTDYKERGERFIALVREQSGEKTPL